MPHYYAIDARVSFTKTNDSNWSPTTNYHAHLHKTYPTRAKAARARSGSISESSFDNFTSSPVNRLAQSLGPERVKQPALNSYSRHTTPAVSTRRGNFIFADSLDPLYEAKSNRRSIWQRLADNVDRCVLRVVGKFYYK